MKELFHRGDPTTALPPAASRNVLRRLDAHDRALHNIRHGPTEVEDVVEFVEDDVLERVETGKAFYYDYVIAFVATVFEDLDDDLSKRWLEELADLDSQELVRAEEVAKLSLAERNMREMAA